MQKTSFKAKIDASEARVRELKNEKKRSENENVILHASLHITDALIHYSGTTLGRTETGGKSFRDRALTDPD